MKFLLLNQTFYPDVVSTAQHLTDLALRLAERGHEVTVISSRRAYDDPARRFSKRETWRGIRIHRVGSTAFGKKAKWRRAVDFGSFIASCCAHLLVSPQPDVVVALTSPPLISFIGAWFARLKGSRFFYWVMDLNPDESVAAGWLREGALLTRTLEKMSRFSLRRAERIIALDRFMCDRIAAKNIAREKIAVIAPWSHDNAVRYDAEGRAQFRAANGLNGKFVVMYSGNHSPCHPLDTLLETALRLASEPNVVFCFVGGGSEFGKVQRFAQEHQLKNIRCLPYQPIEQLSASLSAADLQTVVMGNPFVGTIHPCKIYNLLVIGARVLYIGPRTSHLWDVLSERDNGETWHWVPHGDVDAVVQVIQKLASAPRLDRAPVPTGDENFSQEKCLQQLVATLEAASLG